MRQGTAPAVTAASTAYMVSSLRNPGASTRSSIVGCWMRSTAGYKETMVLKL
jgi:hypothetical protein